MSLQLRPNQIQHFQKVLEILKKLYFYIDGSETGLGKTYIAAAIAIMLQLPCIVICPKSARNTWRKVFTEYKVNTYQITKTRGIITYETLRSTKGHQPLHGLLTRSDLGTHPLFYPTQTLTAIIQAGVFIIFDEAQKLKNDSDQHHASAVIMKHFYTVGSGSLGIVTTTPSPQVRSRFALLSASLVDKEQHVINLMEMVGFIASARKSNISQFAVQDALNKANQINSFETSRFIVNSKIGNSSEDAVEYIYSLFVQSIRPMVMSTIPRPETKAIKDIRNGYYNMTPEEVIVYNKAINRLTLALCNRSRRKELKDMLKLVKDSDDPENAILQTNLENTKKDDLGDITNALIMLQEAKMNAMIRVARYLLSINFTHNGNVVTPKLILFADYYRVIDYLMQNLADFNPVELTGRVSEVQQTRNISAFQEPNNQTRLIIGNPLVGGLSISLHDVTGLFPRMMFIFPNYRINELHQASGRIFRDGSKGVSIIRFFYGKSNMQEESILNALVKKGEVLQIVHSEQVGVKFSNEYENEMEEHFIHNFIGLFNSSMNVT
jgi:hypothetical protein